MNSEAGTEQIERSAEKHSRLLPLGLSASALMIAVDYLLTGNWSGAPYYMMAGLTLVLASKIGSKLKTEQSTAEDISNPYLTDCSASNLAEAREQI